MVKKSVSILLVGIGGYGNTYVEGLLDNRCDEKYYIAGIVDPMPESQPRLAELKALNIPIYTTLEEFYEKHTADLAVISSPIHFHCEQACYALSKGSNVLCEKPLCATAEDGYKMIEASKKTGKFLSIGYQWSHSEAIQNLKKDIQTGLLGKAVRFKTILLLPRTDKYYSRSWAGKLRDSQGRWILDSIANNATAHYIHNMFYLLGDETNKSAKPLNITAELYHANPIESFDTAAMRAETDNGVELLYLATHATREHLGPVFDYEFEKGKVIFRNSPDPQKRNIVAYFNDGNTKIYGDPNNGTLNKLWLAIDMVNNEAGLLCGPEAAFSHTLCIKGMHESTPEIVQFPEHLVKRDEKMFGDQSGVYVEGLSDILKTCYEEWALPSELGVQWSKPGRNIKLPVVPVG